MNLKTYCLWSLLITLFMFLKAKPKGMILLQRELFCVIKQIDVKSFLLEKFVINFTFYILQVL